jgi:hypothetical protein
MAGGTPGWKAAVASRMVSEQITLYVPQNPGQEPQLHPLVPAEEYVPPPAGFPSGHPVCG